MDATLPSGQFTPFHAQHLLQLSLGKKQILSAHHPFSSSEDCSYRNRTVSGPRDMTEDTRGHHWRKAPFYIKRRSMRPISRMEEQARWQGVSTGSAQHTHTISLGKLLQTYQLSALTGIVTLYKKLRKFQNQHSPATPWGLGIWMLWIPQGLVLQAEPKPVTANNHQQPLTILRRNKLGSLPSQRQHRDRTEDRHSQGITAAGMGHG